MDFLEKLKKGIISNSIEDTYSIAKKLADILPLNSTLALHGDLGAGKTTFVKGLALAWEIKEPITSPTFNLFLTYKGSRNLLHLDAYRIENQDQADALMLEEFLTPPYTLVVEWPNNVPEYLPKDTIHLHLSIEPDHSHKIILQ